VKRTCRAGALHSHCSTGMTGHRPSLLRQAGPPNERHPSAATPDPLTSPFSRGRAEHRDRTVPHRSAPPSVRDRHARRAPRSWQTSALIERRASPTSTEDRPSLRSPVSRSPTNPGILQSRDDFRDRDHHHPADRRASPTRTGYQPSLHPYASAATLDRLASPFNLGRAEHRAACPSSLRSPVDPSSNTPGIHRGHDRLPQRPPPG